jgi:DNA-binding transcriptional regulator GbsR (MarR family)
MTITMTVDDFKLVVRSVQERIEELKARESSRSAIEDEIADLSNLLSKWMCQGLL